MQDVIDLRAVKAGTDASNIEIWDGIACRGKIESYENVGMMVDTRSGEKVKTVAVNIVVTVAAYEVHKFQAMENNECIVQLLIQPLARPERPTKEDDASSNDGM